MCCVCTVPEASLDTLTSGHCDNISPFYFMLSVSPFMSTPPPPPPLPSPCTLQPVGPSPYWTAFVSSATNLCIHTLLYRMPHGESFVTCVTVISCDGDSV